MLGRRTAEQRQKGQSALGMPGPEPTSGNCELAHRCPGPPQAYQSPTIFVISGKVRSGIPLSIVKALGFAGASLSQNEVSGVEHPAPGRA